MLLFMGKVPFELRLFMIVNDLFLLQSNFLREAEAISAKVRA